MRRPRPFDEDIKGMQYDEGRLKVAQWSLQLLNGVRFEASFNN